MLACFCKTLSLKCWLHSNQWEFLLLLRSRISVAGSALSPAYFFFLSCPRVLGPLALSPASSVPSFCITGFLSTINFSFLLHPHAQTDPEIFTPEPPNEDKGLSTRNDPEGRNANHLLPKASTLAGDQAVRPLRTSRSSPLPALAFSRHWMERSLPSPVEKGAWVAQTLPSLNLWIAWMRGCCSYIPCKASAGHSPKKALWKEEKILAKWLLPKRMRKTRRRQGSPKSQSGSSMSRIGYLMLAVWKKKIDKTGIRCRVYLTVFIWNFRLLLQ